MKYSIYLTLLCVNLIHCYNFVNKFASNRLLRLCSSKEDELSELLPSQFPKSNKERINHTFKSVSKLTLLSYLSTTKFNIKNANAIECDDSISIIKSNLNNKEIVLIGTAHVSEESAKLVERTIQEVKPDIVMIELDQKRVGKVTADKLIEAGFILPSEYQNKIVDDKDNALISSSSSSSSKQKVSVISTFGAIIRSAAQNAVAGAIGGALKSLYKRLEDLGFSAGGEFKAAVTEGRKVGAQILLGDRDVDVTLGRLAQAVENTDSESFNRFVTEVDALTEKMGFTEDLLNAGLGSSSRDSSSIGGRGASASESVSDVDAIATKKKVTEAVENLKQRDLIRSLMGTLRSELPEVYMALIGERDLFMSQSLLEAPGEHVVGVVGMAHMQGIENALQKGGFKVVVRNCSPSDPKLNVNN